MGARIRERDLIVPALQIAASRPNGEILTEDLIPELEAIFQPEGQDAETLAKRNDSHFSQKVRNLISHHASRTSMFSRGYAERIDGGFRVTDAGRAFLDTVPTFN